MSDSEVIQIDLTDEIAELLLTDYVRANLTPESNEVFDEALTNADEFGDAVLASLLNESVIQILTQQIAEQERVDGITQTLRAMENDIDFVQELRLRELITTPCWTYA